MMKTDWNTPFENAVIYYVEKTNTTMGDARSLASAACPHGTVVTADFQHSGRGRFHTRKWHAKPGESLLFTLVLEKDRIENQVALPLLFGLAIVRTIHSLYGSEAKIKWPNDVYVKGKKLSGILVEATGTHVLAGIGINCTQEGFSFDAGNKAVSIKMFTRKVPDKQKLLEVLLLNIKELLEERDWLKDVEHRLYRKGEETRVLLGDPEKDQAIEGTITGLDKNGFLLLKDAAGNIHTISSGEIPLS